MVIKIFLLVTVDQVHNLAVILIHKIPKLHHPAGQTTTREREKKEVTWDSVRTIHSVMTSALGDRYSSVSYLVRSAWEGLVL